MDKLRFGICGLGCMGRSHFARLREHPRAEIVAVCDRNEARRGGDWNDALGNLDLVTTAGGRVSLEGINAYATPDELIADPTVDVVLITLPTRFHCPVAIAALGAGKHVLTEKPMAYRPGECTEMIRAANAAGRTLMVAQCIRFWPQYEKIKELMDAGRIGQPRFMTLIRRGSPPTYSAENWLLDGSLSGGALLDLHVHDIDFAQHLFGVPDTVFARGMIDTGGGIGHVAATYGYSDGRYVQLDGGWAFGAPYAFEMGLTVHGETGTLEWKLSGGDDVHLYAGGAEVERIPCAGDALRREQDYFIDCVQAGRPVSRCAPTSTRTSINLAWLERRALETGRLVEISDRLRAAWGA